MIKLGGQFRAGIGTLLRPPHINGVVVVVRILLRRQDGEQLAAGGLGNHVCHKAGISGKSAICPQLDAGGGGGVHAVRQRGVFTIGKVNDQDTVSDILLRFSRIKGIRRGGSIGRLLGLRVVGCFFRLGC